MNRSRALISISFAAIMLAGGGALANGQSAAPSGAAPQVQPLGAFTVGDIVGYPSGHAFAIQVPAGSSVQSALITIPPGFDFGWHHHTGAVVVTVTGGTLTLYDTHCQRQEVTAGQGFLEEVGTVHRARNEGAEPAVLVATYLGVPAGHATDVPEAAPCEIGS